VKWCLENGISAHNTTPITALDLSSVLLSALENNTVNPASAATDVTYDILLAEDNLVNQKLALKILEKYGHSIELAENGSLALQAFMDRALQNKPFDVILVRVDTFLRCLTSLTSCRWTCRCLSWVAWRPRSGSGRTKCSTI
jgi:osomolarity two-component system sensor histidine kinase NIK1